MNNMDNATIAKIFLAGAKAFKESVESAVENNSHDKGLFGDEINTDDVDQVNDMCFDVFEDNDDESFAKMYLEQKPKEEPANMVNN